MVRSLSDDTDCFKSFKFSAVTLKFFYFSKTYNRILKSLSTFHDEKWLSNRREKLILNVIKQRTNQFLINSSLLLLLFSVMHISFVWTIKIQKNGLSRIQKRSLLNTDRKKYANFLLDFECVNYNNGHFINLMRFLVQLKIVS